MYTARRQEGDTTKCCVRRSDYNLENKETVISSSGKIESLSWYDQFKRDELRWASLEEDEDFFSPIMMKSTFVGLEAFGGSEKDFVFPSLSGVRKGSKKKEEKLSETLKVVDAEIVRIEDNEDSVIVESKILEKVDNDTPILDSFRDKNLLFDYSLELKDPEGVVGLHDLDGYIRFEDDIGMDVLCSSNGSQFTFVTEYSTTGEFSYCGDYPRFFGRANIVVSDFSIKVGIYDISFIGSSDFSKLDFIDRYELLVYYLFDCEFCLKNDSRKIFFFP